MEPIVLIEEFPHPVEDLWAWWTDPAAAVPWLTGRLAADLRVGGEYRLEGSLGSRPIDRPVGGPISALEEEYLLELRVPGEPPVGPAAAQSHPVFLGVRFQPMGPGRTRLRLEQRGWPEGADGEAARGWFAEAWADVFARLRAHGANP